MLSLGASWPTNVSMHVPVVVVAALGPNRSARSCAPRTPHLKTIMLRRGSRKVSALGDTPEAVAERRAASKAILAACAGGSRLPTSFQIQSDTGCVCWGQPAADFISNSEREELEAEIRSSQSDRCPR